MFFAMSPPSYRNRQAEKRRTYACQKISWCNQRYILVVYLPPWDVRTSDVENYDLIVYSVVVQPALAATNLSPSRNKGPLYMYYMVVLVNEKVHISFQKCDITLTPATSGLNANCNSSDTTASVNKRSMDLGNLLDTCNWCDKWQFSADLFHSNIWPSSFTGYEASKSE